MSTARTKKDAFSKTAKFVLLIVFVKITEILALTAEEAQTKNSMSNFQIHKNDFMLIFIVIKHAVECRLIIAKRCIMTCHIVTFLSFQSHA